MRGIRRVFIVLLLACLVASIAAATSSARSAEPQCSVGGPPAMEVGHLFLDKPSSPMLVIGCGESFAGPFEIVAYTGVKHHWLCTLFLGSGVGGGECGGAFHESRTDRNGILVTSANWAWGGRPGTSSTTLEGRVRPDAARVEVRYHRNRQKPIDRAEATVAQVNGELLSSLDQATPFGRFAVVLPGCTDPQGLRVVAFDSEGQMIGSERGKRLRWDPCRPQHPSRNRR